MRDPSGDQTGLLSGPLCVTSFRTALSATDTIEMSAEPPLAGSLLMRSSNAMLLPSGDHAKLPTVTRPMSAVESLSLASVRRGRHAGIWSTTWDSPCSCRGLHRRRLQLGRGIGDGLAVGRPGEAVDAVLERGDRFGTGLPVDQIICRLSVRSKRRELRSVRQAGDWLDFFALVSAAAYAPCASASQISVSYALSSQLVSRIVCDPAAIGRISGEARFSENLIDARRGLRLRERRRRQSTTTVAIPQTMKKDLVMAGGIWYKRVALRLVFTRVSDA